ncbi:(Fe-S)-binding protein [Chloroflexota bacterium]
MEPKLITEYEVELTEPGCTPGSGKLAVAACLKADISGALPYLNAVLTGADYYPEDHLLIFRTENRAFAYAAHEVKVAPFYERHEATAALKNTIDEINNIWARRQEIKPRNTAQNPATVIALFRLLPGQNCRECGYQTCLAFAADLQKKQVALDKCPVVFLPEQAENRQQIENLICGEAEPV